MSLLAGSGRRSKHRDKSVMAFVLAGLGLRVMCFLWTFFGNLIKAAVSRQREFLADASAVQFTRNPEGIGGALKKIGGVSMGGRIASPAAPEMRHMFFTSAISSGLSGMLASHPPLPERSTMYWHETKPFARYQLAAPGDVSKACATSHAVASTAN